jgi:acyl-CoA synthetase (AMP-forming)/AMP-acid ligase II/uncharacterized OB-fold protein
VNLTLLLDMVADGMPDRTLLGDIKDGITGAQLRGMCIGAGQFISEHDPDTVVYLGGNGVAFALALFGAAYAGRKFLPVNYRLSDDQISEILARQAHPLVITDTTERAGNSSTVSIGEFVRRAGEGGGEPPEPQLDEDAIAVLLMTSGTTAAPKSAVLRHRHLMSYVLGSVEFASADESDATIVSVPPYHIAAVANLLSNLYVGRRIFYLDRFTAAEWLQVVRQQEITHAMVVPTMLARIVRALQDAGETGPPTLRSLSYGGAKVTEQVVAKALDLFPETGFVNAYGLTETASSIALLGPEDHRVAHRSQAQRIRARLLSVGRPLPGVELEVHDEAGVPCPPGQVGEIVVRGPQVAGEYLESGSRIDQRGWFRTRDNGFLDDDGYLFVQGRADDTIIRGGENIAPSEIESVLAAHPDIADVAVAGIPDDEWGQRIAAFVVRTSGSALDADELRHWARPKLRGSKTPDEIVFVAELPTTQTGKVLRRSLVAMIADREAEKKMPEQIPLVDYLVLDETPHLAAHECTACGARYFDRRNACAGCFGTQFRTAKVPSDGEVKAFTIVAFGPPGVPTPFVAAVVDCEGTSVQANIINVSPDPEHVSLGMKVRLATYSLGADSTGVEAVGFGYEPR